MLLINNSNVNRINTKIQLISMYLKQVKQNNRTENYKILKMHSRLYINEQS